MLNFISLEETLPLLVEGMGGIFVVIMLIYLLIKVLLKVFPAKV
jgi:hypothetical protein